MAGGGGGGGGQKKRRDAASGKLTALDPYQEELANYPKANEKMHLYTGKALGKAMSNAHSQAVLPLPSGFGDERMLGMTRP